MSPTTIKKMFFILFLQSFNVLGALSLCLITSEYTVHVVNRLPPNSQLKLHCASKNDELGFHTTPVNSDFKWRFCENYAGNTLFFCHLHWGSKQVAFNVFESKWNYLCESNCYWEARRDGIYFSGKDSPTAADWEKKHDWA